MLVKLQKFIRVDNLSLHIRCGEGEIGEQGRQYESFVSMISIVRQVFTDPVDGREKLAVAVRQRGKVEVGKGNQVNYQIIRHDVHAGFRILAGTQSVNKGGDKRAQTLSQPLDVLRSQNLGVGLKSVDPASIRESWT